MWPKGSLEEVVQNLVKTWEMELSHKTRVSDFKSIHHEKFCISVNGELQASIYRSEVIKNDCMHPIVIDLIR